MKAGELISVVLLTLVLLNMRRTVLPGICEDAKAFVAFLQQEATQIALAALSRIILTAALPAYVVFLMIGAVMTVVGAK